MSIYICLFSRYLCCSYWNLIVFLCSNYLILRYICTCDVYLLYVSIEIVVDNLYTISMPIDTRLITISNTGVLPEH